MSATQSADHEVSDQSDDKIGSAGTPDQPVDSAERLVGLDFIRGIAVMGILAANIVAFGQPFIAYLWPDGFLVPHGDEGGWMWIAQFVLIDGKMRGLFTLLFGAGMILFLERAWARGSGEWLQFRRLAWLMLFGLVHTYLIWAGDILFAYSIAGMILLLCARLPGLAQLKLGLLGYLAVAITYAAMMVPLHLVADTPLGEETAFSEMRSELVIDQQQQIDDGFVEEAIKSSGDYGAFVQHRIGEHGTDPYTFLAFFLPEALAVMLIGMGLYKLGFFSGGCDPGRQRFWGWVGLLVGGILHLAIGLWSKSVGFTYYAALASMMGLSVLPRLIMVLGFAALLSLYGPRATGWLGQRISAAGRAAFTNYLGTSIVMLFVFHGWALGLFGELNRPQLYLVVLLSWVMMLAWSKPWLERFRYGPLEWLWRCLTYGKVFPLKR